jgi:hypothetical protein
MEYVAEASTDAHVRVSRTHMHSIARPQVVDGETPPHIKRSCEYIKQSRTADKGSPSAWGLGEVLTTPFRNQLLMLRHIQTGGGLL